MPKLSARELALLVLQKVDQEGAYANLALNQVLEKHRPGKLDRAFATELAYGSLRMRMTLDWVLGQFIRQSLDSQSPAVLNILRLGVYQLLNMDKVPVSAVCNEAANMARKHGNPGVVGFVNGVLRNVSRRLGGISFPKLDDNPVEHISVCYSHPAWMVRRWLEEFGQEETIKLCRANNQPAPNTVRTNTLKISREGLSGRLKGEGISAEETAYAPEGLNITGFLSMGNLPAFREGLCQVQDEGSILVGRAVMPAPDTFVLDCCSAPGGKTTHLAQLMGNRGKIVAVDLHEHKLSLLRDNCVRLGVTIVEPLAADAGNPPEEYCQQADYVLVDAPCSGLGVLRRRPDVRWRKVPEQLPQLTELQAAILAGAARCVKPGGVLVYSTCTVTREENTEQVNRFLNANPDFVMDDLRPFLPGKLDQHGTMADGLLQTLPHRHGMDGFFIARMRKKGIVQKYRE